MSHKKKAHDLLAVAQEKTSVFAKGATKWFNHFTFETRIGMVFLSLLTFVLVFFSLAKFSPVTGGDGASLRFLSFSFWKSSLLILVLVGTLWGWYLSPLFKQAIHRTLGFKENDYLFVFFVLFALFGHLVGMQESLSFATDVTNTISVSMGYYILLVLVLAGLIYSLVRLLDEAKIMRKTDFMGFVQSREKDEEHDVASLFDEDEE